MMTRLSLIGSILTFLTFLIFTIGVQADVTEDHVVLSWNDLGMHCMNKDHAVMSILPPYNTLYAQVIQRGGPMSMPVLLDTDITVEYSIPGNTYSAGKTDFWDWDVELFGVDLPTDVGLTGNGLTGTFDYHTDHYVAEGIPVTPFTDAAPTVEEPYQNALVIARDAGGFEIARSRPVIPVSTEVNCVTSGCHSSEQEIVFSHELEGGYNPNAQPIFCASCHASPALGTTGDPEAGYFSFRIHDQHKFLDETLPGPAGCNKCHPGPEAQCLRGTMANDFGMICQDCHGDLAQVSSSIEDQGRIPWMDEPACSTCHTAQYGEPAGQLFRLSTGHGGLYCSACHGSPHAIFPSREATDNIDMISLQGHAGTLSDCTVCHGVVPNGPGPHGSTPTSVGESIAFTGTPGIETFPNPMSSGNGTMIKGRIRPATTGRLLVFDSMGRTLRLLRGQTDSDGALALAWDGKDGQGRPVGAGTYFLRWDDGGEPVTGKVLVIR